MPTTIFSPDGEVIDYRTVSERLPQFDAKFPVEDGYRVIRSHYSAKEFGSELVHLYEMAIQNGHSPRDVGLPFIEGFGVIFKAELFKGDTLIRNASAFKQVTQAKDWESGETAAFQRLMAACGLGGTDMDVDDQYDRISSGLEVPPESNPVTHGYNELSVPQSAPGPKDPTEVVQEAPADTSMEAQEPAPEAVMQRPKAEAAEEIRPQLLNQLAHVAKLAGEPIPEVRTVKEAKTEIRRLNALSRAS